MNTLTNTDFHFDGQKSFYRGKVRDVYNIDDELLVMIVTDRISAFDVVLPAGIPYKGEVLNKIAAQFLDATSDILPNWKLACPDSMVTVGLKCKPFPVEMIVRGYLTGSAWREYKNGVREICGVKIPNGMREHQKFDKPIITPTTKAAAGQHDENISRQQIIDNQLVSEDEYKQLEEYSLRLFQRGTDIARQRGLLLVDTKYEFGTKNGQIYLIDEIHTPDSSRYFYADNYQERFEKGLSQRQLSKEFVREWLMQNNFSGAPGQQIPTMSNDVIQNISNRYIELYERITGNTFSKDDDDNLNDRIYNNIVNYLKIK